MSFDDLDGPGSNNGKGRMVLGGKVAGGVKKNESGQVTEAPGELFRSVLEFDRLWQRWVRGVHGSMRSR